MFSYLVQRFHFPYEIQVKVTDIALVPERV